MLVETLRYAKLKSMTNHLHDPALKEALIREAITAFLDHDEFECYNHQLMEAELNKRWGPLQDAEYEKRMLQQWRSGPVGTREKSQRERALEMVRRYIAMQPRVSRRRPDISEQVA
jgi:hypothetical protein